jgi:hypothetical protein
MPSGNLNSSFGPTRTAVVMLDGLNAKGVPM